MIATVHLLRCRPHVECLGRGPAAAEVVRRAAGTAGLVALMGDWAGGGAILAGDPIAATDRSPGQALACQPQLEEGGGDVVGGGWFGWISYSGPSWLGFYDSVLRLRDGQWFFEALWSRERAAELRASRDRWRELLGRPGASAGWQVTTDFAGPRPEEHLAAVERAIELIRAGQIYQVNVCTRLRAGFAGSPAAMFADAAELLQPRRAAFVDGGDRQIASMSPELFLHRRGPEVTTAPIKGTWPAGHPDGAAALRGSAKDVAENIMIVDLTRNDLGRLAEAGSVRVASLLDVQRHPGVWHLVSAVTARLRAGTDDAALLAATFPPGSVTGAPKIRAVEAIAALESQPRAVYTGAVGYASPTGGLELAVAIRTFEFAGDGVELGVGGGVTADSVPAREWRECLHKADPLLRAVRARPAAGLDGDAPVPDPQLVAAGLIETVLVRDGRPVLLADHLARLDRSSRELYRCGVPGDLFERARAAAAGAPAGRAVLRIELAAGGTARLGCTAAASTPTASDVRSVTRGGGVWRHKWADRRELKALEAALGTPLMVAADGTVLETSRGNVFLLRADGALVTPPLREDLLPGVTRRALLDLCVDTGRRSALETFSVAEMTAGAAFWTSSVSGLVPIRSVDGVVLPDGSATIAELAAELGAPVARTAIVR